MDNYIVTIYKNDFPLMKIAKKFPTEGTFMNQFALDTLEQNLVTCEKCNCDGCKNFIKSAKEMLEKFV